MPFKTAPISGSFTIIGMLGFVFSVLYWNSGRLSAPWGFTFALFSVILFVSSLISLRASVELEHSKARTQRKAYNKKSRKPN